MCLKTAVRNEMYPKKDGKRCDRCGTKKETDCSISEEDTNQARIKRLQRRTRVTKHNSIVNLSLD